MAKKQKLNLTALSGFEAPKAADSSESSNTAYAVIDAVKRLENSEKSNSSATEPRTAKRIFHTKIYSSPLNDYPIDNLEETENLLLLHGLLEPLSVNYDEDTDMYELESGDRRFHALKNLFARFENENNPSDIEDELKELYTKNLHGLFANGIYCMVENGARDRDSVRTRIIIHNETARPFDAMRTASKINELAEIYTRQNLEKPKSERINVNEKIAELLKGRYTVRQIIRYKNFDNLIDELKNVIINHEMSISEISKYHSMTAEEQSVLAQFIETYHVKGNKLELPSIEEIKQIVSNTFSDEVTSCHLEVQDTAEEQITDLSDIPAAAPDASQEPTSTTSSEHASDDLDALKVSAVKKLQEAKSKKDTKINDAVDAIMKKSKQLEKSVLSYIAEENSLDLQVDNLVNEIDTAIEILTSIKSSLAR